MLNNDPLSGERIGELLNLGLLGGDARLAHSADHVAHARAARARVTRAQAS